MSSYGPVAIGCAKPLKPISRCSSSSRKDNIYATCSAYIARGVTINRPPRDGRMAFIRTPDGISIELLQAGEPLPPAEPWTSMANTGSW
jgi:lactoylglutathione lyase